MRIVIDYMNIFLTSFLYMHQRTSYVSFISTIFYDDNSYHVHIPSIHSLCSVKAFFLFQNFVESFKLILYDFSYITFKQIHLPYIIIGPVIVSNIWPHHSLSQYFISKCFDYIKVVIYWCKWIFKICDLSQNEMN